MLLQRVTFKIFTDVKHSIHVCLRKYRGLKTSGFGVVDKAVSYQTFHLTVTFKHVTDSPETSYIQNAGGMFLVVVAVPVYTTYKGMYKTESLLNHALPFNLTTCFSVKLDLITIQCINQIHLTRCQKIKQGK